MNQLFEECINDVGLRFKRKKKDSETIEISPQKETKNRQKLIKEKILPPKNPNLIDLKKSLEKLETFSKLKNENQPKNMVLEIIPEKNKEKQSIISEKNKELQTNELEKNFSSYPKLPNQINLNLNVDYYNKEVSPQLRWTLLIKEVANFEFNRIKLTYKNNPSFLKKLEELKNFICENAKMKIEIAKQQQLKERAAQTILKRNPENLYNIHKNKILKEMIKNYENKIKELDEKNLDFINKKKYKQRKNLVEKVIQSNCNFEINENIGKLLDDDANKIIGNLYKNNQDRMGQILAGFQAIKKLKNDTEQLSDDIDKNLKYVGKEIFGDIEVLLDFNSFFQKMNLH